jgi:type IV secretion system protein TrbL
MACSALPWQWGECAADVAKSVAGDAFEAIARSFGRAARDATAWLWKQMNAATAVHLGGDGFSTLLAIVATIAVTVGVGLFVLQIIQSVLRREPGGLARAVKGLFIAFIAGAAAAGVVNLLLAATDALCSGVVETAVGTDPGGLGQLVLGSAATATLAGMVSGAGGAAGVLLLSLAILAAVVIVYIALVVRKVLIVVTAVFAPLAFAGSLADITVSWTRRWIEITVALIVSKLILILIFVIGYFMLVKGVGQAGSGVTQEITQLVSGAIILALAGFAPWLALKVVHFTGDHAHQLHALAATSTSGAVVAGRMGQKVVPLAQRATSALSVGSGSEPNPAAGSKGTGPGSSPSPPRPSQGPDPRGGNPNPGFGQPGTSSGGGRPPRSPGSPSSTPPGGGPSDPPGPGGLSAGGEGAAGAAV